MNANEYQKATLATDLTRSASIRFLAHLEDAMNMQLKLDQFEKCLRLQYLAGKLNGEAGEVAEVVFKAFRDDIGIINQDRKAALFKELGDVMWYVAMLCNVLEFKLSDVMDFNLNKLADRKDRGVLTGDGDER